MMVTVKLMPVKSTTVLFNVKMNGDTKTAQNLKISGALAHSLLLSVKELGPVKISMLSP
jgi:hypothetical protein